MAEQTDIDSIDFKPATGGLISTTRRMSKGGKFGPDYKSETAVHPSLDHAVRHMKKTFGESLSKKKKEKEPMSMKKG